MYSKFSSIKTYDLQDIKDVESIINVEDQNFNKLRKFAYENNLIVDQSKKIEVCM